jgi:peptide deformylase
MINPKVISISSEKQIDEEWCLSLPWELGSVARPQRATIQRTDLKWKIHLKKVEWYNARIMLHEIDHLNGILFIDKLI